MNSYHRVVAAAQLLQVFIHFFVVHLEFHALALELPPHAADFLSVLLHLLCITTRLPLRVFSGYLGLGGSDPILTLYVKSDHPSPRLNSTHPIIKT